jgi:anti-sigma factor RsiW
MLTDGPPMSTPPDSNAAELMSAYVDGELDEAETARFEDYLAGSPEAQAQLDELRKMVSLVGTLPEVTAPPDFSDKLARRLRRRQGLAKDALAVNLVSLPFQVLSILVILAVATLYMLAELERQPTGGLERDPTPRAGEADPDDPDDPHPPIP